MFVFDVKDFRQLTEFAVQVTEESALAVLTEAGVDLSGALELRVRVKDMDERRITSRSEPLDKAGSTFRINLYVMPGTDKLSPRALKTLNRAFRHECKHIAQFRANGPVEDKDTAIAHEKEAWAFEREAVKNAVSV